MTAEAVSGDVEIELTYLAREIPKEVEGVTPDRMVDVYVPEAAKLPTIRLRRRGDIYEITKKTPLKQGDYSAHLEQTIPLNRAEFESLRLCSKRIVEKERYAVIIDGHPAEIDVFHGDLAGLVVIDFEFSNEGAQRQFQAPECCLADVTQEDFIAGGQLAGKTYDDIAEELEKFAYKKLAS